MNIILLPVYNEEECIGELLDAFCTAFEKKGKGEFKILIVNDGSLDATESIARDFEERLDLYIISHPHNMGLAQALRTGFNAAVEMAGEESVIITMDGDNSHLPSLVFRMMDNIYEGCDIVIASRYQLGSRIRGVTKLRRLLSAGAGWLFRIVVPIEGVRDYTCGYRAYSANLLQTALLDFSDNFINEEGFSCMAEVLVKLRRYNPVVREVPMILRYDQKRSDSKMNVTKTVIQTLSLLIRSRFKL